MNLSDRSQAFRKLNVEFNLAVKLEKAVINDIRLKVILEVKRAMMERDRLSPERASMPFDEPIVESTTLEEREKLHQEWIKQLSVSMRYLEQLLEIDAEICGNKEQGMPGIKLPIHHVRNRGKHQVDIQTHNAWGSIDYREPALQTELKKQFTKSDLDGSVQFDQEGYDRTLRQLLAKSTDTSTDLAVLAEEDKVDVFDAAGIFVCQGVVRDVSGHSVSLNLHGNARLQKGYTMRKKSDRNSLLKYRENVFSMMKKLNVEHALTDRNGLIYEESQNGKGKTRKEHEEKENLNQVEVAFFHAHAKYMADHLYQIARKNYELGPHDIPRGLLDDEEQAVAFALGGIGHPCSLIQGPPGTGKTTVARHLADYFQMRDKKTLILSHSNRGLDVLLNAIKKADVKVHRGGTEESVCDPELLDDFIRRDLKHPRKSDYMTESPDNAAFEAALANWNEASGMKKPEQTDFVQRALDEKRWEKAWEDFDTMKRMVAGELQMERGLVAGATLNSFLQDEILELIEFDVVIIDEASKAHLHEILPALKKAKRQIIFIGDHKQLGNIDIPKNVKSFLRDKETNDHGEAFIGAKEVDAFERGPFAMMAEQGALAKVMLRTNRRSLPGIVELVSKAGYDGKLKAGKLDPNDPDNVGELLWVDTKSRADRKEKSLGTSKINLLEARLAARRLAREFSKGKIADRNTGVITMYRKQGKLVQENLRKEPMENESSRGGLLKALASDIATVDSFQGSERDRIHILTTRSNDKDTVGFLENVSRVNVAFSRARESLTIYGDSSTLIDGNPDPASREYFRIAYETCQKLGRVIDVFPNLPRALTPETQKSQTHAARRQRARRKFKRERKAVNN